MRKTDIPQKYRFLISYFKRHNPEAQPELKFSNSYELLVAVILSAQCTDKRVNLVTPALFQRYSNPSELANASLEDIYELIKSVSYPNSKAKHLKGMAEVLVEKFNGTVPDNMEDLQTLPGVGRKTANVILAVIFDQPAMAVDTHVFRVANRLGIVENADTPLKVEQQLTAAFPDEVIPKAHHWLILHGRYVCLARKPKCDKCGLTEICEYFKKR
ncbi:MAG: endonuclease III [Bacteroidales bacterium]|nr:endonuclease III [Bacteroidales bacterium]